MARSRKLRQQWELYENHQYEQASQQTRTLLPRLSGSERNDAYRLVGLCYRWEKRWGEAVYWLQRACEGSDWAQVWAELAIAATLKGDQQLSEQAFEQVRICQQAARNAQLPGFFLQLYWYACALCQRGETKRARAALDELAAAYRRVHGSDTTFLLERQMPFLSSFLDLVVGFHVAYSSYADGLACLRALGEGLDAEGQQQVERAIHELQVQTGQTPGGSEA